MRARRGRDRSSQPTRYGQLGTLVLAAALGLGSSACSLFWGNALCGGHDCDAEPDPPNGIWSGQECSTTVNPIELEPSAEAQVYEGTIYAFGNPVQSLGHGTCGGQGPELVFEWEVPTDGSYEISVYGDGMTELAFWMVWNQHPYEGTCQDEIACQLSEAESGHEVHLTGHLEGARSYYLVVDTMEQELAGEVPVTLEIQPTA